ncbi:hypothetical protein LAUMK191_03951 [Mycobacterium attenuatum]|uniref:Uncharacterized protein n=1 Tax=Mycobacterium attenuatum TaxID=2341086 RepID=A0A498QC04_9MYCO|nr:hypothetical protein [Mycobacterium attenuatum]VBA41330.1 hypothetical protein LAUMK136_03975 [Mycobacterium attenuatum]VBA57290.1 hypothetical protein LAUMK191_03951 [Mycobacterium attenuatum]
MPTTSGSGLKAHVAVMFAMTAMVGLAATLPVQWRASAGRAWSYGVYYLGYRLLSVQLCCGSLAVSAVPFVVKHA